MSAHTIRVHGWFSAPSLAWMRWSNLKQLLSQTADEWSKDNAQRLGASLAFYSLLSLSPLLVVMVAIAASVFGKEAVRGQLAWEIRNVMGPLAGQAVQAMLVGARKSSGSTLATVLSVLTVLFGASSAVIELQSALNLIWRVPSSNTNTVLGSIVVFIKERFFSFALIIGSGLLVLASVVWSAWIAIMGRLFSSLLPIPESLLHLANFLASFVAITFVFAAIYKVVPNVRLKWSDVLVGASVTSLVFTVGKQLIGLYLGKESFASTYGAAGSLVILLVWVYYSAQLFFFGAEFTKVYTHRHGSRSPGRRHPAERRTGSQPSRNQS